MNKITGFVSFLPIFMIRNRALVEYYKSETISMLNIVILPINDENDKLYDLDLANNAAAKFYMYAINSSGYVYEFLMQSALVLLKKVSLKIMNAYELNG